MTTKVVEIHRTLLVLIFLFYNLAQNIQQLAQS